MKVKLYGIEYDLVNEFPKQTEAKDDDCWGYINQKHKVIFINKKAPRIYTFGHEIAHAMLEIGGRKHDEGLCSTIGYLLETMLESNDINEIIKFLKDIEG